MVIFETPPTSSGRPRGTTMVRCARALWIFLGVATGLVASACDGEGNPATDDAPVAEDAPLDAPMDPSALTITPSSHDYGLVVAGQTEPFDFTVRNTGSGSTGPVMIEITGTNASEFAAGA